MANGEKEALAIYEMICATSGNRPVSGTSVAQLTGAMAEWRANNPALAVLTVARPEVHLAFLKHSLEWLKAEARVDMNFKVCGTLMEAIVIALQKAPKPLPADLVQHLLSEFRQEFSMARYYFPFDPFISLLSRDQVTKEIRTELRRIHLQFPPSATGKINERTEKTRNRLAQLMWVEGEKELCPGRGPWSQTVFDEIRSTYDEIARMGWESLLEHCRSLEQTVPGAKWNKRSREMLTALGETEAVPVLLKWLALGPTPGQLPGAISPVEDSSYQKGVVWLLALSTERDVAIAIAEFGLACLRKIPMIGAVSQKVGLACVQALGAMECQEAVAQLTRLRAKVKYSVARRMIEKSLHKAAERTGLSVAELEDISVGGYGLNAQGIAAIALGDSQASVHLGQDGQVNITWQNADGKHVKSAPAHLRKAFAKEVRAVPAMGKEREQAYMAQRSRLESMLLTGHSMPLAHWKQYFLDHPLLGFLGRRLIWVFSDEQGCERSGIWWDGAVCDSVGAALDLRATRKVRLWHPLSSEAEEVVRWRDRVFSAGIRQPFRQAFREFYQLTDDERQARMYSNRFAGILMRQHQFASLCRARGWDYRLMGAGFDGANVPSKKLDSWNVHVEFYVDLPSDRNPKLLDSALGEQSGMGINVFIGSDQVRFYRDRREIPLDAVPPVVYSEMMRDVDLFTSVSAVGDDETWSDQGVRGAGVVSDRYDLQEYSSLVALRAELLSRVLPHTTIADRCKVQKTWLEVRGNLATYRIQLGWGGAVLAVASGLRWLAIPRKLLDAVPLDLSRIPVDLDYRTEMVLRKAHVLADDWRIESPDVIRQLMPE